LPDAISSLHVIRSTICQYGATGLAYLYSHHFLDVVTAQLQTGPGTLASPLLRILGDSLLCLPPPSLPDDLLAIILPIISDFRNHPTESSDAMGCLSTILRRFPDRIPLLIDTNLLGLVHSMIAESQFVDTFRTTGAADRQLCRAFKQTHNATDAGGQIRDAISREAARKPARLIRSSAFTLLSVLLNSGAVVNLPELFEMLRPAFYVDQRLTILFPVLACCHALGVESLMSFLNARGLERELLEMLHIHNDAIQIAALHLLELILRAGFGGFALPDVVRGLMAFLVVRGADRPMRGTFFALDLLSGLADVDGLVDVARDEGAVAAVIDLMSASSFVLRTTAGAAFCRLFASMTGEAVLGVVSESRVVDALFGLLEDDDEALAGDVLRALYTIARVSLERESRAIADAIKHRVSAGRLIESVADYRSDVAELVAEVCALLDVSDDS
jgi:hypothetical protein